MLDKDTAYQVLARKYRPSTFANLIGQDAMVRTLKNAFETDRIAQAFILAGIRGTGKTTTARILAKGINCVGPEGIGGPTTDPCGVCEHCFSIAEGHHVDVMEMDAASHGGIDDIREIIGAVSYPPASARYKIYIIDEVHMLSLAAFNGLLKTLEEPPEYVKFIFATTEIRKVPVTVLSRCQRFDLRRIEPETMIAHLERIAGEEAAEIDSDALALITRASEGSVRDAVSLLDQAIGHGVGETTADQVRSMLGLPDKGRILDLFEMIPRGDAAAALNELSEQYAEGVDPMAVLRDLAEITRRISVIKITPGAEDDPTVSPDERTRGRDMAKRLPMRVLSRMSQMLLKALNEVARAPNAMMAAETAIIQLTQVAELPTLEELVRGLENKPSALAPPSPVRSVGTSPEPPAASSAARSDRERVALAQSDNVSGEDSSPTPPASGGPGEQVAVGAGGGEAAASPAENPVVTISDKDTAYQALVRKYRPATFADLIGQNVMVRGLKNAFETGRIAQAFIFAGIRGTGKTTTARILAKGINCVGPEGTGGPTTDPCGVCEHCVPIAEGRHADVMEMDAASRTGINDIREIIDAVCYRPVSARYKIYIIDEVHMLSSAAFDGLLKTLEEPPAYVKFIFATTEIRKVPVTVLSRCQRFDLRRIEPETMIAHLERIAGEEYAEIASDALALIARTSEGSVRDAVSLLDQAINYGLGKTTADQVSSMLGSPDRGRALDLFDMVLRGDAAAALNELSEQYAEGEDPVAVLRDLSKIALWTSIIKITPGAENDPTVSPDERTRAREKAERLPMGVLSRMWQMLTKVLDEVARVPNAMMAAETAVIRLADVAELPTPEKLVRGLENEPPLLAPPSPTRALESSADSPAASPVARPGSGDIALAKSDNVSGELSPPTSPVSDGPGERIAVGNGRRREGAAALLAKDPESTMSDKDIAYQVLARKHRPANFAELIEQEIKGKEYMTRKIFQGYFKVLFTPEDEIQETLRNSILNHDPGIIFTGIRGLGKTTTARILAKGFNCIGPEGTGGPTADPCGVCEHCVSIAEGRHVDVMEMDAASLTGIDDIREIIDMLSYRAASARYKIHIIDEVHRLSKPALGLLGAALEKLPEHVKFIFATTEILKIPRTVRHRSMRFDLRRIEAEKMIDHLESIAKKENAEIASDALALIAWGSEGSVRDAVSLLDQAINCGAGEITADQVRLMMGLAYKGRVLDLFDMVLRGDAAAALNELSGQYAEGADPKAVLSDLAKIAHKISCVKIDINAKNDPTVSPDERTGVREMDDPTFSPDERTRVREMAERLPMRVLSRMWQMLLKALEEVKRAPNAMMAAEMEIIRLTHVAELPTPEELVERLKKEPPSLAPPSSVRALEPPSDLPAASSSARPDRGGVALAKSDNVSGEDSPPKPPASSGSGERIAVGGGGAVAAAPLAEGAETALARFDSFETIVELIRRNRDMKLLWDVEEGVRLVSYRPGWIEFEPGAAAPTDLALHLRERLRDWTGNNWSVSIVNSGGAETISEARAAADRVLRERAVEHPLVRGAMDVFPGAEIVSIITPEERQKAAEAEASPEVPDEWDPFDEN